MRFEEIVIAVGFVWMLSAPVVLMTLFIVRLPLRPRVVRARGTGPLQRVLPTGGAFVRWLGKTRLRLILEHQAEIERVLRERDDARKIVSSQQAEVGELSREIERLRDLVACYGAELATVTAERHQPYELLSAGVLGLAASWRRLAPAGDYGMAAREILALLQQLGVSLDVTGGSE